MWTCHKCGKPVYFAERKQSLGYDWHPECLRCEECGKRLNPGQHAEHKGVPYCHVPCYGALFGPQLFGHGTRVESHKSFGQQNSPKISNGPAIARTHLEAKLKSYNQYFESKSGEIKSREVNGRLILEGSLRIFWGVQAVIHLKENDDQRTVVTVRKRNSYRQTSNGDSDEDVQDISTDSSCCNNSNSNSNNSMVSSTDTLSPDSEFSAETVSSVLADSSSERTDTSEMTRSTTLPHKLDIKNVQWDELDDLLQVEKQVDDFEKRYQTMPSLKGSQGGSFDTDSSSTEKANLSASSEVKEDESTMTINGDTSSDTRATMEDSYWPSEHGQSESSHPGHLPRSLSGPENLERVRNSSPEFDTSSNSSLTYNTMSGSQDEVVLRRAAKTGSHAIRRRPGKRLSRSKIKRRCSINGHFYDRETSFFTPPHGSQMSVWVSSLVTTQEVIKLMLDKYKVDSNSNNFSLFAVRDNGEQRRLKEDEYPLITRILLGPHEDVVRLFLMDSYSTPEVSNEVAQFLNLTLVECRGILNQYNTQEEREIQKVREKHMELKRRIKTRMEELKVRL